MDQIMLRPSNADACLERAKVLWEQMEMWQSAGWGCEEDSCLRSTSDTSTPAGSEQRPTGQVAPEDT